MVGFRVDFIIVSTFSFSFALIGVAVKDFSTVNIVSLGLSCSVFRLNSQNYVGFFSVGAGKVGWLKSGTGFALNYFGCGSGESLCLF